MTDFNKIKELALANGFKLKEQASGNMDLNAYVYDFANAIEQATKAQAVPEGFVLMPKEPTFKMAWAYQMNSVAPVSSLSVSGYKAMIEAQEPSND